MHIDHMNREGRESFDSADVEEAVLNPLVYAKVNDWLNSVAAIAEDSSWAIAKSPSCASDMPEDKRIGGELLPPFDSTVTLTSSVYDDEDGSLGRKVVGGWVEEDAPDLDEAKPLSPSYRDNKEPALFQ